MKTNTNFLSHLAQLFLELETFQTKIVAKIGTFYIQCLLFQKCCRYNVVYKNTLEPNEILITYSMRFAYCIFNSKITESKYTGCLQKNSAVSKIY
jgi:hypothetical protein